MRWLSQRTPTVDGERLYAFTAAGELICLESASGKERWRKDYIRDFAGKKGRWAYCDYPLVDGDKLICTPGGASAVVALNKATGELLWKAAVPGGEAAAYSLTVAAEINGTRQYLAFLDPSVIGVAAADGKLLWKRDRLVGYFANRARQLSATTLSFSPAVSAAVEAGAACSSSRRGRVVSRWRRCGRRISRRQAGSSARC